MLAQSTDKTRRQVGPTSLADLKRGIGIPGDSGESAAKPPPWLSREVYDPTFISRFFNENVFSFVFAWHCSLVIGFSLPSLLAALVFTNNSNTAKKALKRYVATGEHLIAWHVDGDIFDTTSKSFVSMQGVRAGHAAVRKDMTDKIPPTKGKAWMSMYNMACVQSGFCGALTIVPKSFGLHASAQEMEKYVEFWRCIGYQLGVSDEYNLCSRGKSTADSIIWEIIDSVLLPDIARPPREYHPMADAYIEGLNMLFLGFPVLSVRSTLAYTYSALGRKVPCMCLFDILRFYLLKLIVCLMSFKTVRFSMNYALKKTMLQMGAEIAVDPGLAHLGKRGRCTCLGWVVLVLVVFVSVLVGAMGVVAWESIVKGWGIWQ
jgi:hypothetical protein